MNTLCFSSSLTSAELAAWVQAVGSILAIFGAAGIAVWVARTQHNNALALHAAEQRHARTELAKTLSVLAQNCAKAVAHVAGQLHSKYAIYEIADGRVHCDRGEIGRLDSAIEGIPLYSLASALVTPTIILSAIVRQFLEKVEMVLSAHRNMDGSDFEAFFREVSEMNDSMSATCDDIALEVERIQETD